MDERFWGKQQFRAKWFNACSSDYQDAVQGQESQPRPGEQVQAVAALAGVEVVGLEVGEGDHEVDRDEEQEACNQEAGHQKSLWSH